MKKLILSVLLLVGFSVSAQAACQVSEDTVETIVAVNTSKMMAKPKYVTIKGLIADDACMANYLEAGDAADLAHAIIQLGSVREILSAFISERQPQSCSASAYTVDQAEYLRTSGMHSKVVYVSMKGTLAEDACLSSKLNQGDIAELAQRLIFHSLDELSAAIIIENFLAELN